MSESAQRQTTDEADPAALEKSAGVVQTEELKRAPRKWVIAAFIGYMNIEVSTVRELQADVGCVDYTL